MPDRPHGATDRRRGAVHDRRGRPGHQVHFPFVQVDHVDERETGPEDAQVGKVLNWPATVPGQGRLHLVVAP